MPRTRKPENRGLPARWQHTHGAYYYRVPPGLEAQWDGKKRFRLGATLPEAYKVYAERVQLSDRVKNIGALLDRYELEVVPKKAPATQASNRRALTKLRKVFGAMPLTALRPVHVYQYVDKRGKKVASHREIEVLSHAYTKAVEWGYIDRHPFKGEVRLEGEQPRNRYVEDWEIEEALKLQPKRKNSAVPMVQAYIRLKLLTGMSKGDLLRLKPAEHFKDDGIHVQRHKTKKSTGKRTIYEWTPERRAAVEACLAARPAHIDITPWLFCNKYGESYVDEKRGTTKGFDSIWQDFMARLLRETKVTERFTDHDLRAKAATDAESLEKARAMLAHIDSRMTARVYRRKPERA